jgi:release factor glutamine methyltransferase
LQAAAQRLAASGIEQPRREARVLLAHALGVASAGLVGTSTSDVPIEEFETLVARRAAREPVAMIIGRQEFWSLDFAVSTDTLVPRADSETLIDAALATFPTPDAVRSVLDLGTGTGCLLLAVLRGFPSAFGVGIDLVPAATALARRNAAALDLAGRTAFLNGNWATAIRGRFDLVLCNPPYIPAPDIARLMPEVARHEPMTALSGGADGLDAYRALVPRLASLMAQNAAAILELGEGQAGYVRQLANVAGFDVHVRPDLAGIDRAMTLQRPG